MEWKGFTTGVLLTLLLFSFGGFALAAVSGAFVDNGDGTLTEQFTAPQSKWVTYADRYATFAPNIYAHYLNATYGCPLETAIAECGSTTREVENLYEHHKRQKVEEYHALKLWAAEEAARATAQADGDSLGS